MATLKETTKKTEKADVVAITEVSSYAGVIRKPRITEKAAILTENNVYVFDVATTTNKNEIKKAVEALYKVTPRKIAIVQVPSKKVRNRKNGKIGIKQGGKKAYVYLKKGVTIEIL
jgi:large subunit ribosomal protein L23